MSDWNSAIDHMITSMAGGRLARWHDYVAAVRFYQHHVDWEPRWWAWIACLPRLPRVLFNGVPRAMGWEPSDGGAH